MSTKTHISNGERLGRWLGGMWRGYVQGEHHAVGALVARGWSAGLAKTLPWIVKLGVLAILLYVAFWVAFVLALAVMCLWMVAHADLEQDDPQPEWRDGLLGFGLYHPDGSRIDPHDPDEEV